jgi:hypothetical protein
MLVLLLEKLNMVVEKENEIKKIEKNELIVIF